MNTLSNAKPVQKVSIRQLQETEDYNQQMLSETQQQISYGNQTTISFPAQKQTSIQFNGARSGGQTSYQIPAPPPPPLFISNTQNMYKQNTQAKDMRETNASFENQKQVYAPLLTPNEQIVHQPPLTQYANRHEQSWQTGNVTQTRGHSTQHQSAFQIASPYDRLNAAHQSLYDNKNTELVDSQTPTPPQQKSNVARSQPSVQIQKQGIAQESSFALRMLQQKQAREQQSYADEKNLYGANPFQGLEQNQAKNTSFQKNDQSSIISEIKDDESKYYHQASRLNQSTEHDIQQFEQNKHRNISNSVEPSKMPSSRDSRGSQRLREGLEESRKKNLHNVSKQIMSPSKQTSNQASNFEDNKSKRPPSHPTTRGKPEIPKPRIGSNYLQDPSKEIAEPRNPQLNMHRSSSIGASIGNKIGGVAQSDNLFQLHGGDDLKQVPARQEYIPSIPTIQRVGQRQNQGVNKSQPPIQPSPVLAKQSSAPTSMVNPTLSAVANQDAIQMQISMMQQQMILLQQQQQVLSQLSGMGSQSPPQNHTTAANVKQDQNQHKQHGKFENIYANHGYQNQQVQSDGGDDQSQMAAKFKPYSLKDFKQIQEQVQVQKMGGLGANIGSEDWERAQKKKEQQIQYAEQVRQTIKPVQKQPKAPQPKEPTAREKAIEFAKQVPKPKQKTKQDTTEEEALKRIEEEDPGNTMIMHETTREQMMMLDAKNKMYANELEKIKQLFD